MMKWKKLAFLLLAVTLICCLTAGAGTSALAVNDAEPLRENDQAEDLDSSSQAPAAPSGIPFVDVSDSDYFYDAVLWAVQNDITSGTDATHFSPEATCTRAQVMTFLWRFQKCPDVTGYGTNPFIDVKPGDYYFPAVHWAVLGGFTKGTDASHFSPDAGCTRAQVMTFLWRAAGEPWFAENDNPFVDLKKDDYYYEAVLWAVFCDVTKGTDASHFSPDLPCTRAQIVTFLYRNLAYNPEPVIIMPPTGGAIGESGSFNLEIRVLGGVAPYEYQWQKGGVAIPGATDRTYAATEPGLYTCRVTDSIGRMIVSIGAEVTP